MMFPDGPATNPFEDLLLGQRGSATADGSAPAAVRAERQRLDRVFKALASECRRQILDELRTGPKATGELVLRFPELSRFAVMQHLGVLIKAQLVVAKRSGRTKQNCLNPVPLQLVYERWVSRYEGLWAGSLTDLARRVEDGAGAANAPEAATQSDSPRIGRPVPGSRGGPKRRVPK
jgi:DNA-binding transcriptional ArsR family regulator